MAADTNGGGASNGGEALSERPYTVGIDIGGTFTDCTIVDSDGTVFAAKSPTTPEDRSQGFFASLERAAEKAGKTEKEVIGESRLIVHGTTTGTNAIVSRSGAKVGLLCTAGHEDVMHLMKGGGRTSGLPADELLDVPATAKPVPLVPKTMVAQVVERVDVDGDLLGPVDDEQAAAAVQTLVDRGADAIAVSLLWAVKNPESERRVREIAERVAPDAFVCSATDLIARVGEYERTTTAVMNAYIGPADGALHRGDRERPRRARLRGPGPVRAVRRRARSPARRPSWRRSAPSTPARSPASSARGRSPPSSASRT